MQHGAVSGGEMAENRGIFLGFAPVPTAGRDDAAHHKWLSYSHVPGSIWLTAERQYNKHLRTIRRLSKKFWNADPKILKGTAFKEEA